MNEQLIISQTEKWIKSVVIDLNFCPFASKAMLQKGIRYSVIHEEIELNDLFSHLLNEFNYLDNNAKTETSFLIFKIAFSDFENYLSMVKKTEKQLIKEGYEGIYQLASFHPQYCFAGSNNDDASNYTNRSPYAMLHVLREDSLTKALNLYPHPEKIPENNIELAHKKGLAFMQMLRLACFDV